MKKQVLSRWLILAIKTNSDRHKTGKENPLQATARFLSPIKLRVENQLKLFDFAAINGQPNTTVGFLNGRALVPIEVETNGYRLIENQRFARSYSGSFSEALQ